MKRVAYFDVGQWPIHVGFTNNEAAFKREMKRLKASNAEFLQGEGADAQTLTLISDKGKLCVFITIGDTTGVTLSQVAAMIAHEAVHVGQALWRHIGEDAPGDETQAYFVQMITQSCLDELGCFDDEMPTS